MQRERVVSSNISSIGYDEDRNILEIEFNDGAIYQYSGVPEQEYKSLLSASSKGSYLNKHMKGKYRYTQVR